MSMSPKFHAVGSLAFQVVNSPLEKGVGGCYKNSDFGRYSE